MGDRVRIGELLAGIGAIALVLLLGFGDWFTATYEGILDAPQLGVLLEGNVTVGIAYLGWLLIALLVFAAISGIVFFLRVLTGDGPERGMLQSPIAFLFSLLAFVALLVRLLIWQPGVSLSQVRGIVDLPGKNVATFATDVSVASGAWLALGALLLMMIGTWVSLHDERTESKAAKAATAALLADVVPRKISTVSATPDTEAAVVADDAAGDDDLAGDDGGPTPPTTPSTGESA